MFIGLGGGGLAVTASVYVEVSLRGGEFCVLGWDELSLTFVVIVLFGCV